MTSEHFVKVKTASGAGTESIISDYLALNYTTVVNDVGVASVTLPYAHPACATLYGDKSRIEIWRLNPEYGLTTNLKVFEGFTRSDVTQFTHEGYVTFYFEDLMSCLRWRNVAYYSGIPDISEFSSRTAETILKNLVYFNAGAGATVAPYNRFIAGVIPQIAVLTDQLRGNVKSWSCQPSDNLLEALQKVVASGAGGDFSLTALSDTVWNFEFFPGQLGTDRTGSVFFDVARGNMVSPRREHNRQSEKTVAFVGGDGKGSDLVFVTRTGPTYSLPVNNPPNHHEVFLSAGGFKSIPALEAVGDRGLYESRARRKFSFTPLQTRGSFYQVHYFLGDKVTATIFGSTTYHKIQRVTVSQSGGDSAGNGEEHITIDCVEL